MKKREERDRIRERATDRNTERQRKTMERHREMESLAGCCADWREQGETRPQPRREVTVDKALTRPTDRPGERPGGVGAGPVAADLRRSAERRGRTGCEKGKEAEVPGGRGARGAGRKRGGAAGRGPPEKRPNFLPRQSQEAGAWTQGPGSPSPTSGAPPVTSLRGHQVHRPWPLPASSPRLLGEVGGGGRGLGHCRQWRALLRAPLSQRPLFPGPQFSHLSKGQREEN